MASQPLSGLTMVLWHPFKAYKENSAEHHDHCDLPVSTILLASLCFAAPRPSLYPTLELPIVLLELVSGKVLSLAQLVNAMRLSSACLHNEPPLPSKRATGWKVWVLHQTSSASNKEEQAQEGRHILVLIH